MKLPISKRLLLCADMVPPCGTVADVGTDHGYLGIHLLQSGKCSHVIAADLREKPLASARANAAAFGIPTVGAVILRDSCEFGRLPEAGSSQQATEKAFPLGGRCHRASPASPMTDEGASDDSPAPSGMSFVQSDGLQNIEPGSFGVLVLAGMGGDLITRILAAAPWLEGGPYTLILQPQSAANELRRWLGERRWSIDRERLVRDGGFLYAVMAVTPGQGRPLSPGEQYLSPALRREKDPLWPAYHARIRRALELTVAGIEQSTDPADFERAEYYKAALHEIANLERNEV